MSEIKTVYVRVLGGTVQDVIVPEGVEVIVEDFDEKGAGGENWRGTYTH